MTLNRASRKHNQTVDARFSKAIAEGFAIQAREIENSQGLRRTIKQLRDDATAKGEEPPDIVTKDGPVPYVDPDYVDSAQKTMEFFRDELLRELPQATSSKEQHLTIMRTLERSFRANVTSGWPALATQLLATAIEHGYDAYAKSNPVKPEQDTIAFNRAAQTFWQDAITDVSTYARIALQARTDLRHIATAYAELHGLDEHEIITPLELAEWRYCKVKGVDRHSPDFIVKDQQTYNDIMNKVMRDDMFGPYQELFNNSTDPELAWFIGRSMEVLHKHQPTPKPQRPVFMLHDELTPEGRLPRFYDKLEPPAPKVSFADTIVMMQDEKSQAQASQLIKKSFDRNQYSEPNILGLLDAAHDFAKTHKIDMGDTSKTR